MPFRSTALLVHLSLAGYALCAQAQQCYQIGERCAGAEGKPAVEWRDCCNQAKCLPHPNANNDASKWGRFCQSTAQPKCHQAGERCAGAVGKPPVEWLGCCGQPQVDCIPHPSAANDGSKWGRFCLSKDGGPSKATFDVKQKQTLLPGIYTADPSAHVINGKLYVYCSTDRPDENVEDPNEMFFLMTRYTIMSFNDDLTKVTNEGEVLPLSSVKWAQKQLWAPTATCKAGGKCYLYFPAKAYDGLFRIGAAVSVNGPLGPFVPESTYIKGTFSVDPVAFDDTDGSSWLVWGGEWGGQLENWSSGSFNASAQRPTTGRALQPRIAKLRPNMVDIESVRTVRVVDGSGNDIQASDVNRKFFEAPWVHKANGKYYLSYSTGETHLLAYATSDSVAGPYQYRGTLMTPPIGWTTHHSIVQYKGRTLLFYHDSATSGKTNLRQVKMQEIWYESDGRIKQVTP